MAGRPVRRGHPGTPRSRSRKAFDRARARVLALAVTHDQHRPGSGDVILDQATQTLEMILDQVLSGVPRAESRRN